MKKYVLYPHFIYHIWCDGSPSIKMSENKLYKMWDINIQSINYKISKFMCININPYGLLD